MTLFRVRSGSKPYIGLAKRQKPEGNAMKKVSSCLLALVFALGSSIAIGAPGHGDRDRKGAKQHRGDKHYNVGRHHSVPRMAHSSNYKGKHKAQHRAKHHKKQARHQRKHRVEKHHRRHQRQHDGWRHNRWDRSHKFHKRARNNYWKHNGWRYNGWNYQGRHNRNWHHNRRIHRDRHYGSYLGAAIVGSALTYSLYHLHDNAVCYDSHDDRHGDRHGSRYQDTEVVGCHRIERLADGSQVRVDVPLAECR